MVRPEGEIPTHSRVMYMVAKQYRERGYDVAVDRRCDIQETLELPEYETVPPGCGFEETRKPDVIAADEGDRAPKLIEIETKSTIDTVRTRCQVSTFAENGDAIVWVPNVQEMERQLQQWGLSEVTVQEYDEK